mgnify:CR=1 FL=1
MNDSHIFKLESSVFLMLQILTGSAFLPLKDDNIFKNCKVVDGAVTWMDEEIDCAPEFMYENSFAYPSSQTA